ncbi:unnamed protein product [Rotaria magnacalcarata]|uniref:E3 ubiquitin-protein ligase n=1 Tax=Rotaria magnacalcarata TaxID=392030 RepID=A0A819ASN3_9BILA|nr:unnamed protein product [Rotaria magnacalcarata]CAF2187091.1 unnamed protein product [Rotaria magnacalcarata]CAF3782306.1 unnamed protein product [Rotaria magnacalcarata]CAF3852916.1 unnamed protein product [Rotaria magnacalcarata]
MSDREQVDPKKVASPVKKSATDASASDTMKVTTPHPPLSPKKPEIPTRELSKLAVKHPSTDDAFGISPKNLKQIPAIIVKNNSRSLDAASGVPNEEKVDINHHNQNETEEMKMISSKEKKETEICAICLDDCTEPKELDRCGHVFCCTCIDQYFQSVKPQCPCCFTIYGEIRGNQPDNGTMKINIVKRRLPGFEHNSYATIEITYHFPDGTQNEKHPNPGMPYYGTTRIAYLPDNSDGRYILKLLKKAFELRQIFTVGQSRTTGRENVLTWNDIHHKTSCTGGMERFGYPDDTYISRVLQELAAKGIQ